jgi:hypothetical protein
LEVVVGVIEMMDLGLEMLDPFSIVGARQFKATSDGAGVSIDVEKIPERAEAGEGEDEHRPHPFAIAEGIDQHPDLEGKHQQGDRTAEYGIDKVHDWRRSGRDWPSLDISQAFPDSYPG